MKKGVLFPILIAGMLLSSCAGGIVPAEPSGEVTHVDSMSLSSEALFIDVGKSAVLTAYIVGNAEVKWQPGVGANKVFSIARNGKSVTIYGIAPGKATISAIAGDQTAYCEVTVTPQGGSAVEVRSVSLNPTSASLYLGEDFLLKATIDSVGGTPVVSYSTGKTGILQVTKQNDTTATVKAIAVGEDEVVVTAGDHFAKCRVTVIEEDKDFSIKLNKSSISLIEGESDQLVATVNPFGTQVYWDSENKEVATVDQNGQVRASKVGNTTITATISKDGESRVATCAINVQAKGSDDDYEAKIKAWSEPGHIYMHYLRTSDTNYDKWAVWMWQSRPNDLEGSLWGASSKIDLNDKITPETFGKMTKSECGGTGEETYVDAYGVVIDIDLTVENLKGGKTREISPLVSDWTDISRNNLGFLIVDQTKMDGSDNWTSDGSSNMYIKKLGRYLPSGKESYLHVYCVEGNVANYTTQSGKQEFVNPTATDTTGQYRSKNDITNLWKDDYAGSATSTSTTFLNDRPGVGYQIFVPSFADSDGDGTGDIRGIINKLDYIEGLGAKVLWLTPIQESDSYHGYDVTDYYKIDPKFGTLQDYQELIYKAHKKGMKVLMDMVINHTSKSNVLFKKSQVAATEVINGKTINYRDMYLWKYQGDSVLEWDREKSPATDGSGKPITYDASNPAKYKTVPVESNEDWYRDGTSNYYYYGKFGSGMAELNYSCQATRDYMTDMCKYWLSFGLDGFRLDAIKHIYLLSELDPSYNYSGDFITYDVSMKTAYNEEKQKTETTPNDYTYDRDLNVIFWKQFAGNIKSAYPNCFLVGENYDGWNARMAPFYEAIDSQFDFSTYYHVHESTVDGIVAMGGDLQTSLNDNYYKFRAAGKTINGAFTSNHDVARFINHSASTNISEHHAEVNNTNKAEAIKRARWAGAITILTPGVSWIYYGDEIGLSGNIKDNPEGVDDHGNNVDRWYRQPMKWSNTIGDKVNGVVGYTFGGMKVVWDNYNKTLPTVPQQVNDPNSLYTLFKYLNAAKNDSRYPTYGWIENQWGEQGNQNCLCMAINDGTRKVYAFINANDYDVDIAPLNQGTIIRDSKGNSNGNATSVPANGFVVVVK